MGAGAVLLWLGFSAAASTATVHGTAGPNVLRGTKGPDTIYGGAGKDILYGLQGNDALYGGRGNDRLFGGPGNDHLYGGPGNDTIDGGAGRDTISCGSGRDVVHADRLDRVASDCEVVIRPKATTPLPPVSVTPPPPPPPPSSTAPSPPATTTTSTTPPPHDDDAAYDHHTRVDLRPRPAELSLQRDQPAAHDHLVQRDRDRRQAADVPGCRRPRHRVCGGGLRQERERLRCTRLAAGRDLAGRDTLWRRHRNGVPLCGMANGGRRLSR